MAKVGRGAVALGSTLGGVLLGSGSDFGVLVKDGMRTAIEALKLSPAPEAAATAAAAATALTKANAAALQESVNALKTLLKAQQSASNWRIFAALAAPIALGVAIRVFGWDMFGWVTPRQLHTSLERVTSAVVQVGESLGQRLDEVDAGLHGAVRSSRDELRFDMQNISEQVALLDRRIEPLEADARRSAEGVGVLCDLVATSGLFNSASADSLRRLDTFTGHTNTTSSTERRVLSTPSELMPPLPAGAAAAALSSSSSSSAALEGAAPAFMRALMSSSSGDPASVTTRVQPVG